MRSLHFILVLFVFVLFTQATAVNPIQEKIKTAGTAEDYPGSAVLTIFDSTSADVQESGLSYVSFHRLYKILTVRGALSHRTVIMDYDPLSASVEIREVTVYRKNGAIEKADLSQIRDYPAPARAIYWGARQKMLEIGRLYPGDALEVKLFRKGFTYALLGGTEDDERFIPPMRGHFYDIVPFWSSQPVQEKVYRVLMPADKKVQYEVYNGEVRSAIRFQKDKTLYTFSKTDILPFKREPNMVNVSDEAPKLLISTSPDWFAKSKWFCKVNEDFKSFESTDEIRQKVKDILKGARGEQEKISRLTHWVADEVRYSGLTMGPGEGYTLHKGEMTFRDRCGVCKDKAGMLITMLRAAGFESYPAMTMAGSRIDKIPADQFNHSVTIVKLSDGKYHLLDPTWVPFVRELWSSAEQQQEYLMGLPQGADLATTPVSLPEKHYYKINGTSKIHPDGRLTGKFTLEAEGQSDARIRRMFTGRFKNNWLPFIQTEMLKQFPQMRITHIEFGDAYDYSNPIQIGIEYEIPDFALITKKEIIFTPLVASNIFNHYYINEHLFMDVSKEEKQYNFRSRSSKQIVLREIVKLPKYKKALALPETEEVKGNGADFSGGYDLKGRNLSLFEDITFKKRIYTPEDWPSFRKAVKAQKRFAEEKIILKR